METNTKETIQVYPLTEQTTGGDIITQRHLLITSKANSGSNSTENHNNNNSNKANNLDLEEEVEYNEPPGQEDQDGEDIEQIMDNDLKSQSQSQSQNTSILKSKVDKMLSKAKLNNVVSRLKIRQVINQTLNKLPTRMVKSLQARHYTLINDKAMVLFNNNTLGSNRGSQSNSSSNTKNVANSSSVNDQALPLALPFAIGSSSFINGGGEESALHGFLVSVNQCIVQTLDKFLQKIPFINPSNSLKMTWDVLIMMIEIMVVIFIPIHIIYNIPFKNLMFDEAIILIPFLLIIDILVNMSTGYFEKGELISNRLRILINYCKYALFYDCLEVMPVIFHMFLELQEKEEDEKLNDSSQFYQLLLLLFMFRIKKLFKTLNKFQETYSFQSKTVNLLNLFKLFAFILLMGHLFASIWLYLCYDDSRYGKTTWLSIKKLEQETWFIQYLYSYYFAVVTMMTIGFGDISPTNQKETLMCIILIFFSCGMFGYNINMIDHIFQELYKKEDKMKKNFTIINGFMRKKNISDDLQFQIREYLDYVWKEASEDEGTEQLILAQLSDVLREKLQIEANKVVLVDSPVFRNNFSEAVISKTVALIKEYKSTPDEVIFLSEDRDDCAIYFIDKGRVEIFIDQSVKGQQIQTHQTLQIMEKGEAFGCESFFTGCQRGYNVRSKEFTTFFVIKRSDFLSLLAQYPEDYESYCFIKDSIQFYNNYEKIKQKCFSCKSGFHQVDECPYIHFVPRKNIIIKRENFSMPQLERVKQNRKEFQVHLMGNVEQVFKRMEKFQIDNEKVLDEYELKNGLTELINEEDEENLTSTNIDTSAVSPYSIQLSNYDEQREDGKKKEMSRLQDEQQKKLQINNFLEKISEKSCSSSGGGSVSNKKRSYSNNTNNNNNSKNNNKKKKKKLSNNSFASSQSSSSSQSQQQQQHKSKDDSMPASLSSSSSSSSSSESQDSIASSFSGKSRTNGESGSFTPQPNGGKLTGSEKCIDNNNNNFQRGSSKTLQDNQQQQAYNSNNSNNHIGQDFSTMAGMEFNNNKRLLKQCSISSCNSNLTSNSVNYNKKKQEKQKKKKKLRPYGGGFMITKEEADKKICEQKKISLKGTNLQRGVSASPSPDKFNTSFDQQNLNSPSKTSHFYQQSTFKSGSKFNFQDNQFQQQQQQQQQQIQQQQQQNEQQPRQFGKQQYQQSKFQQQQKLYQKRDSASTQRSNIDVTQEEINCFQQNYQESQEEQFNEIVLMDIEEKLKYPKITVLTPEDYDKQQQQFGSPNDNNNYQQNQDQNNNNNNQQSSEDKQQIILISDFMQNDNSNKNNNDTIINFNDNEDEENKAYNSQNSNNYINQDTGNNRNSNQLYQQQQQLSKDQILANYRKKSKSLQDNSQQQYPLLQQKQHYTPQRDQFKKHKSYILKRQSQLHQQQQNSHRNQTEHQKNVNNKERSNKKQLSCIPLQQRSQNKKKSSLQSSKQQQQQFQKTQQKGQRQSSYVSLKNSIDNNNNNNNRLAQNQQQQQQQQQNIDEAPSTPTKLTKQKLLRRTSSFLMQSNQFFQQFPLSPKNQQQFLQIQPTTNGSNSLTVDNQSKEILKKNSISRRQSILQQIQIQSSQDQSGLNKEQALILFLAQQQSENIQKKNSSIQLAIQQIFSNYSQTSKDVLLDLDIMKSYAVYFPHNNSENVIKMMNMKRIQRQNANFNINQQVSNNLKQLMNQTNKARDRANKTKTQGQQQFQQKLNYQKRMSQKLGEEEVSKFRQELQKKNRRKKSNSVMERINEFGVIQRFQRDQGSKSTLAHILDETNISNQQATSNNNNNNNDNQKNKQCYKTSSQDNIDDYKSIDLGKSCSDKVNFTSKFMSPKQEAESSGIYKLERIEGIGNNSKKSGAGGIGEFGSSDLFNINQPISPQNNSFIFLNDNN